MDVAVSLVVATIAVDVDGDYCGCCCDGGNGGCGGDGNSRSGRDDGGSFSMITLQHCCHNFSERLYQYLKIPIISAGLILFRNPFLGGLFSGGGAYYRGGGGLIIGMIFVSRICLIKFLRIMFIGQVHGLVIPLSVN